MSGLGSKRLHYGSLANAEAERIKKAKMEPSSGGSSRMVVTASEDGKLVTKNSKSKGISREIKTAIKKGNINITTSASETMELSDTSLIAKQEHAAMLAQVEANRRARTVLVPTNDTQVKIRLRKLSQPITLFGERAPGRRERLRALLARLAVEGTENLSGKKETGPVSAAQEIKKRRAFLTEGIRALKFARREMAHFSLTRAKARVMAERTQRRARGADAEEKAEKKYSRLCSHLKNFASFSSQVGDDRPLSSIQFSPADSILATSSWSGQARLWSVEGCAKLATFKGHTNGRVTDLCWNPNAQKSLAASAANLATGGSDNTLCLWSLPEVDRSAEDFKAVLTSKALARMGGHTDGICRVEFHPSGGYVASTSRDTTWRLWDVDKQHCVLAQPGHSRGAHALSFHPDGSLVATGDLGGNALLWDIRSGKVILMLNGHAKQVLSASFSPIGYHVATGSGDNTVRIWDIRSKKALYTVTGHSKLISHVKYQPVKGDFFVTSSYDKTCKIWSAYDFTLIKTLAGHDSRVMRVDTSSDGKVMASCSYDNTFKIWESELEEEEPQSDVEMAATGAAATK